MQIYLSFFLFFLFFLNIFFGQWIEELKIIYQLNHILTLHTVTNLTMINLLLGFSEINQRLGFILFYDTNEKSL